MTLLSLLYPCLGDTSALSQTPTATYLSQLIVRLSTFAQSFLRNT